MDGYGIKDAYHKYLQSDDWKRKSQMRITIDGKCKLCGKNLNDKEVDDINSITKNYNSEDSHHLLWILYAIIILLCLSAIAITLILIFQKLRKNKTEIVLEPEENLNKENNQDIELE